MTDSVVVEHISKHFRKRDADTPATLQETFTRGWRKRRPTEDFWALRDVTFHVEPGHMLGIIGGNGAGKSTLLRLIGGVGRPDSGHIRTNGRVGALLDLGAGFHPDLTGRENVFVTGIIGGLTRQEVARRFDSIVDFAEMEEFIDSPLRIYSTGMGMRLAFAVAVHTDPTILLVDEVLAVGDIAFQRKCLNKIAEFRQNGCAILLVSHDPEQIQEMCSEALWLSHGEVKAYGAAEVVAGQYVTDMMAETKARTPQERPAVITYAGTELRVNENRFGSMELEITGVKLLGSDDSPVHEIDAGDAISVAISFNAPLPVANPIFGVSVRRADGLICCEAHTSAGGLLMPTVQGNGELVVHIERLDLSPGNYFVDVGAYDHDWTYAFDYHWQAYPLEVLGPSAGSGVFSIPHRWDTGRLKSSAPKTRRG